MAQQRRAEERAKAQQRETQKKILIGAIVLCVIAALIVLPSKLDGKSKDDAGEAKTEAAGDKAASTKEETGTDNAAEETTEETTEEADDAQTQDSADEASVPGLDTTKGRKVKEGDTVNIDYTGYKDGKAFDGGSTNGNGADLEIGSHTYIDGFESGLVGKKVGETVDLNLTFPEDYGAPDLAGADVVFTVTINGIYE